MSNGMNYKTNLWKVQLDERENRGVTDVLGTKMTNNDLYGEEDETDGEGLSENNEGEFDDSEIINLGENEDASGVKIADLSWRVEKMRLEEANTRRFLKARPRFLPYEECRKWVKAWNRWESEEDWKGWIDEGKSSALKIWFT